jgi:hypothetical protein
VRYLYESAQANEPTQVRRLFSALLPEYDAPAVAAPAPASVLSAPYPDGF